MNTKPHSFQSAASDKAFSDGLAGSAVGNASADPATFKPGTRVHWYTDENKVGTAAGSFVDGYIKVIWDDYTEQPWNVQPKYLKVWRDSAIFETRKWVLQWMRNEQEREDERRTARLDLWEKIESLLDAMGEKS